MAPPGAGPGGPLEGLRPISSGIVTTGDLITPKGRFPLLTVTTGDQNDFHSAMHGEVLSVSPKSTEPWGPR